MKPRMSASSGGLVRSGRGSRSRHSVKGMEASSGSTQQTWSTCASVNPSRSRTAVAGNRRLEATRLRQTCSPDRLTPRQASSTTSAQAKAAVPSTNVTAPIGLPSACSRLLGSSGENGHHHARPDGRRHEHDQQRAQHHGALPGGCRLGQLRDQHRAAAQDGHDAEQGLQADRGRRDADVVGVDQPGDDHPEDQPEHRGQHLRGEQGPERRPDAGRDHLWPAASVVAAITAITRRPRPPVAAARRGRAARARPPTPPARWSPPRRARSGRPRPSCWPGPQPIGSGRELSWISA